MDIEKAAQELLVYLEGQGYSIHSLEWYRVSLRQFKKFLAGTGIRTVEEITQQILYDYLLYLRNRPKMDGKPGKLSISAINNGIKAIKGLFRYLCEVIETLPDNPTKKLKYLKSKHTVINSYTEAQVRAILSVISQKTFSGQRNSMLIQLLVDTGLRISEALSIRIKEIDFDKSLIKVVMGKGGKERMVPFGGNSKMLLERWIIAQSLIETNKIFFGKGTDKLSTASIRTSFRRYGKKAGLTISVRPHLFRHTFALMFLRNGGQIFALQKILGHSTLEMTRHYVNMLTEDLQREYERCGPGDKLFRNDKDDENNQE